MTEKSDQNTEEPIIRISDLYKCYWVGSVPFPALNGVDLAISRGEFVVLAGRSGSGKSTLLNIMGGLETGDRGSVRVCGNEFLNMSRNRRTVFRLRHIGFVFQTYNLIRVLTARENVGYVCQLQGKERTECHAIADRWLAEVGLGDLWDRRPDQLSGGQQQRVAVARALAMGPELILADEPTANLDTATGRGLIDLMQRLNRDFGTTFVIASHDPDVLGAAHRLLRIRDGQVAREGEPPPIPLSPDDACPMRALPLRHRLSRLFSRPS